MDKHLKSFPIPEYAAVHTEAFLEVVAWQISIAADKPAHGAVHDLRVAIRRLTNCLRSCRQFYPKRARKKVKRRLQAINKLAGRVRDIDIALDVMSSKLKIQDKEIYRLLRNERRKKQRKLKKKLRRWILAEQLQDWYMELELLSIDRRAKRASDESTREYASRVLPQLADQFFAEGRSLSAESMPDALHRFRLRGKQLRDALELFQPCYDSELDYLLSQILDLHRILGDFNDLVTTRGMLEDRGFSETRQRLFAKLNAGMAEKINQFVLVWQQGLAQEEKQQRWRDYLAITG